MTFLKGIGIGIAIAAPVGPIGLLCISRTLIQGPAVGFVSGLGAATADGIYGLIAAFGVGLVTAILDYDTPLRLFGTALLLVFAWRLWRAPPPERAAAAPDARDYFGAWATTFALTMTNPATILSFVAVIAALGPEGLDGGFVLVAGVFTGSAAWWLGLSLALARLRGRIGPRTMRRINHVSAVALAAFAVVAVWPLVAAWVPST